MSAFHETLDLSRSIRRAATQGDRSGRQASPPGLEQFELRGELGRGGMGVVYRAFDVTARREVALKVLSRMSGVRAQRFAREGQIAASLDHPGVLKVHASGFAQGAPFLVYELVEECRTLDQVFPELGLEARLERVAEVAEALGYAHAHGVVHRDVKPQNLLVGVDGRVRVADFGLGFVAGESRLTRTGTSLGTPQVMAPEQVRGERGAVGPATDVWALGVLLYYALTDALPFDSDSMVLLAAQILEGTPLPPSRLRPDVPAGIERVCLRALSLDPRDRYDDGAAFAFALRHSDSESLVPRRSWKRGARLAAPLVAAGVLLVGALIYDPGTPDRSPERRRAVPVTTLASPVAPVPRPIAEPGPRSGRGKVDTWLAVDPSSADALSARAELRYGTGDLRGTLQDLSELIGVEPNNANHYLRRAVVRSEFDDLRGAAADMEEAARLDPTPRMRRLLADALVRTGRLTQALRIARSCMGAGGSREVEAAALHTQAKVHILRREYQTALALLDRAKGGWDPPMSFYANRGIALRELGRPEAALEELNRALAMSPASWKVLVQRAKAHLAIGQAARARSDLTRARSLEPSNGEVAELLERLSEKT